MSSIIPMSLPGSTLLGRLDHCPNPHIVLMQENDIGQNFALFYLAHAAYLELRGSYKRAEAVFQAGLDRCTGQRAACWFCGLRTTRLLAQRV